MLEEGSLRVDGQGIGGHLRATIAERFQESGAVRYGLTSQMFERILLAVVDRYAPQASEADQVELVGTLHVVDLALARGCSNGNEPAWEVFLTRFRAPLYEAAYRIAKEDSVGRELADELYAELYGISGTEADRRSKLDYYMGRGSLEGWLRTVLAQQYVNRYRSRRREVSLDQEMETGQEFAAQPIAEERRPDDAVGRAVGEALAEIGAEERFLLASWYLDQRTLADIGRQLRVHESTISRRLDRITEALRKRVRKKLERAGFN